jgi:hypothetical protein
MRPRPIAVTSSALALVVLAVGLVAAPAAQAVAYRYWTYWQGSPAGWTFATAGPATTVPADGSIEGWRFAVTAQAGRAGDVPAIASDFAAICGTTASTDGKKRVALVVDPGPASIAPEGQAPPTAIASCVLAAPDATGYQVLRSLVSVRTEGGLICGIADYPTGECAPVIDDAVANPATPPATTPSDIPVNATAAASTAMPSPTKDGGGGGGTPLATIAVAVLLLAFAGAMGLRRARSGDGRG